MSASVRNEGTGMHKILNIIVGKTNEQLKQKSKLGATIQEIKAGLYPIGYLMILKKICL